MFDLRSLPRKIVRVACALIVNPRANVVDCACSGIQRSSSRTELLYPRQSVVAAARAFGLHAIDMVCCFSYALFMSDGSRFKGEC